jgi:NAD(P)-dependent dehydrogenase (short-subunit alcohol dehydrogenase family)
MASLRALVVGGTGGIGYAMAVRLAGESPASHITISGRNKPKVIPHPNMEFVPLDASSMRSIKKYTDAFKSTQPEALDLLVLTQGIGTLAGRTETAEGIDNKMALHFYGKQLLIRELLPALKENARVVIVLDGKTGKAPSQLDWTDLDLKRNFGIANAAKHCVTMTDAMVQSFAAKQEAEGSGKRHFVHAYPGIVNTGIADKMPWILRPVIKGLATVLAVSPDICAEHMVTGARDVTAEGDKSGRFWSCIDDKGHLVQNKPKWTAEEIKGIEDHTWKIIEDALNKP